MAIWECFSQIPNCRTSASVFEINAAFALKADLHVLPFIGNIKFFWWWLWFKSILNALPVIRNIHWFKLLLLDFSFLPSIQPVSFLLPFSSFFFLCLLLSFCPSIRIRLVSWFVGSLKFFKCPLIFFHNNFLLIHFLCISFFFLVICFPEDLDKHLNEPYDKTQDIDGFGEQCQICHLRKKKI